MYWHNVNCHFECICLPFANVYREVSRLVLDTAQKEQRLLELTVVKANS